MAIVLGLTGGLAYAYSSSSTARRIFASPYVGGSDLFACGEVQSTIFVGDPGVPSLLPQAFGESWGHYGVYCAAGYHNELLNVQTQTYTSSGMCTGPSASGYINYYDIGQYSAAQNCGRGRTYYAFTASWLLLPLVAVYASTDTNGGYPEITSTYWPN